MKSCAHLLDQESEVMLVMLRIRSWSAAWVLPVQIKSVKIEDVEEVDTAVDEGFPLGRVQSHLRPLSRARVPSSNGKEGLKLGVLLLQIVKPAEAVIVTVISITSFISWSQVEPRVIGHKFPCSVVHIGKPIVEMGAKVGVYVWDVKLSKAVAIKCPGAVVADQNLASIRGRSWLGWMVSRLVSRFVGGTIAHIIHPVTRPVTDL